MKRKQFNRCHSERDVYLVHVGNAFNHQIKQEFNHMRKINARLERVLPRDVATAALLLLLNTDI